MTSKQGKEDLSGFVFDIQGLSVHDGPGCRTLVFLNGCSLNCFWCSNPEGISKRPLPLYFEKKCILCLNCAEACPFKAITSNDGRLFIDRDKCNNCTGKKCVTDCYTDALKLGGYEISVTKLLGIIKRDRQFWGNEGGVTLTGGEPLLQIDFAEEVLKQCHEAYIHTAIETCGNVSTESFRRVMTWLDWIFFDLKHFNNEHHFKATGAGNRLILENAKIISREFNGRLVFRLPLIPGFNNNIENLDAVVSFMKGCGKMEINILPLHHLGREKYNVLGKEYTGTEIKIPGNDELLKTKEYMENKGLTCYAGSETPF